jgi:hypothetical protein
LKGSGHLAAFVLAGMIGGCTRPVAAPSGVRGVILVDDGTQYVLHEAPSAIGGTCEGWKLLAFEQPGVDGGEMGNLLCWREDAGSIQISNAHVEVAARFPVAAVTREDGFAPPDSRAYLPPFR